MAVSELKDTTVFAFQKKGIDIDEFVVRQIYAPHHNLLTQLGVANSSVFLANCGIWVEGVTDRKYLNSYLSAYFETEEFKEEDRFEPQEDTHYAFWEYAGSNLSHYLFEDKNESLTPTEQIQAQFLSNRIFLIADQDEGKEEKHTYFESINNDNFNYYKTPGREIENLISPQLLKKALPKLLKDLSQANVNEAEIEQEEYEHVPLGTYIKGKFNERCPDTLVAKSGTLSSYYKNRLADLVSAEVKWGEMSEPAKELTKCLYQFILRHNYAQGD